MIDEEELEQFLMWWVNQLGKVSTNIFLLPGDQIAQEAVTQWVEMTADCEDEDETFKQDLEFGKAKLRSYSYMAEHNKTHFQKRLIPSILRYVEKYHKEFPPPEPEGPQPVEFKKKEKRFL